MNDLDAAYAFAITIPALKAVFAASDQAFLRALMVSQAIVKDNLIYYRPWLAAASYLEQSPALHRVSKHDRTTFGDYSKPIAFLKSQQRSQDLDLGLISTDATHPVTTRAYAPRVSFYG